MFKRIFFLGAAILASYGLGQYVAHSGAPSWWPDRTRDQSVRYYREVMQLVQEGYVGQAPADYEELTRAALEGMVKTLDPHSQFLRADAFQETEDELTNAFGGVGIQVEQRDGQIVIVTPIAGTPAERAGMWRGDRLLQINGAVLKNPTVDKIIKLVRGAPETEVALTVFRPSQNRSLEFKLKRERIQLNSVRNAAHHAGGIGYLAITQFSERTGDEFKAALTGLEATGIRALVIDLRNNPGGLLDAAIAVCNEFFERDELIVYTQGRWPCRR